LASSFDDFVAGAAISCGTGTAWGALRRLQLQGGETIAIFGQGPVGLSATQLAVEMGARVIAIDIAPERRKLARQFGAAEVIDPTAHDMVAAIAELTHGEGKPTGSSTRRRPARPSSCRPDVSERSADEP
jgi:D-arabinose 1-dehydrogenase-like Zn-dependent alcohol dehydrogenase